LRFKGKGVKGIKWTLESPSQILKQKMSMDIWDSRGSSEPSDDLLRFWSRRWAWTYEMERSRAS
jgi:hypothetical protein